MTCVICGDPCSKCPHTAEERDIFVAGAMSDDMIQVISAAERLVALGDDPGISMSCGTGGDLHPNRIEKPYVHLTCQSVEHAQAVHQAIVDIVGAARGTLTR